MLLQHPAVQLQLILLWINICVGQIVFERRPPSVSRCISPKGEKGTCELWTKCTPLHQNIYDWDDMKRYLCGFEGNEPRVCCPSTPEPDNPVRPDDDDSVIVYPPPDEDNSRNRRPPSDDENSRIRYPPSDGGNSRTRNPASDDGSTATETSRAGFPNNEGKKPSFLPDDCGSVIFTHNRVIGGQKSERGSWPWMAVLFNAKKSRRETKLEPKCGAALVTSRHVVTAAHCVVKHTISMPTNIPLDPKRLMIRVGVHDVTDKEDPNVMEVGVNAIRIHQDYDPRVHTNDIAVLRLSQPVPFSNSTAPVCLPYDSLRNEDLTGKSATVTGFGLTDVGGSYSDVLMEVNFDIQEQELCERIYERDIRITRAHLCAGPLDGSKDSCQGDSGGPLVAVGKEKRFYLIGVVSFGKNCSQRGYPGVYTRVTEFLDWLTPNLAD